MLYHIARKALFSLDAETAHEFTIKNLKRFKDSPLACVYRQNLPRRSVEVMGLTFKNPVGLAAGMDKNAEAVDGFGAMGFGFIEVGTVTPVAQVGNDKPRCFRIVEAEGVINRMGFNNEGVDHLIENLKQSSYDGIIGINIGKNKGTPIEEGLNDYLFCMEKVYPYAGYIAANISSPNTPGLRSLQYGDALNELLAALKEKQAELTDIHNKYVPLALKIAPDLSDEELIQICQSLKKYQIDGVIATNTTLDRSLVDGMKNANEMGGLSGKPVQSKSTEVIRKLYEQLGEEIPIIGVGGVDSYVAAKEKMMAGAKLVQVFTGLIYRGPELVKEIVKNL